MTKSRNSLLLGFAFVFITFANASLQDINNVISKDIDEDVYNINRVVEDNAYHVKTFLGPMEPFALDDMNITKYGSLKNGKLHNFSIVKRADECRMTYSKQEMCTNLQLGWSDITFDFDYAFKFIINMNGKLNGKVDSMKINMVLCTDFKNLTLKFDKFRVKKIGKINFELSGSFAAKIISKIGNLLANTLSIVIRKFIDNVAFKVIEEKIDEFNKLLEQFKPKPQSSNVLQQIIMQQYIDNLVEQLNQN